MGSLEKTVGLARAWSCDNQPYGYRLRGPEQAAEVRRTTVVSARVPLMRLTAPDVQHGNQRDSSCVRTRDGGRPVG
jgi:hypothetical protein